MELPATDAWTPHRVPPPVESRQLSGVRTAAGIRFAPVQQTGPGDLVQLTLVLADSQPASLSM